MRAGFCGKGHTLLKTKAYLCWLRFVGGVPFSLCHQHAPQPRPWSNSKTPEAANSVAITRLQNILAHAQLAHVARCSRTQLELTLSPHRFFLWDLGLELSNSSKRLHAQLLPSQWPPPTSTSLLLPPPSRPRQNTLACLLLLLRNVTLGSGVRNCASAC